MSLETELLALNQKLLDSIFAGEWKVYAALCADDVTCFEPEGQGHLIHGLAFHKFYFDLPAGAAQVKPQVTMASPVVRPLGADAALVMYNPPRAGQHAEWAGDEADRRDPGLAKDQRELEARASASLAARGIEAHNRNPSFFATYSATR